MLLDDNQAPIQALLPPWGQATLPPWVYRPQDERDLLEHIESFMQGHGKALAVVDRQVWQQLEHCAPLLRAYLDGKALITAVSGEALKSKDSYWALLEALQDRGLRRGDALILIGGGSLLDMGGFVASTFKRGITYYSVPTSLLAMVDASIGGKTGMNMGSTKNAIGSFYEPKGVCIYYPFLKTLPLREKCSAFAEIIKYALLGDRAFFDYLYSHTLGDIGAEAMARIIEHCIAMKVAIVQQDPKETIGLRCMLNLGHTFAHAIESATLYQQYIHGEAVAIGLWGASLYAFYLGNLDAASLDKIKTILAQYQLPRVLKEPLCRATLLDAMKVDKKATHEHIQLILLRVIGEAYSYTVENLDLLKTVWQKLGAEL